MVRSHPHRVFKSYTVQLDQLCIFAVTSRSKTSYDSTVLLDFRVFLIAHLIELDDGKNYRKPLYFMVKTMVSG